VFSGFIIDCINIRSFAP